MSLMFEAFLDGEKVKSVGPYENNCGAPAVEDIREALVAQGHFPRIEVCVVEWWPPKRKEKSMKSLVALWVSVTIVAAVVGVISLIF